MYRIQWLIWILCLCTTPLVGQKVATYFDDALSDSLSSPLPVAKPAESLPLDTLPATPMVATDTVVMRLYDWQDIRTTRDSIRKTLRNSRKEMRQEMRILRDFVREDVYVTIDSLPHDIRIGWGDAIFETLLWHANPHPTVLPEHYQQTYNERFRYTQHLFVEYLYNISYWYSIGCMVDYSGVLWDEVTRNGQGTELSRTKNQHFSNIVIMPVISFSYFHSEYVALYSSLGLGLNINTGTELDYRGRRTALAPAANISLLGVRVGKGRWYGAVEVGGMISLMNTNEVYMLGSRLFTASVGCRL